MSDVVNLRVVRKARVRDEATTKAAENRARFGRTKEQKKAEAIEAARVECLLEGSKLPS